MLLFTIAIRGQFNTITNKPVYVAVPKDTIKHAELKSVKTVEAPVMAMPLDTIVITSPFGPRTHPKTGKRGFHYGLDLRGKRKTVYSMMPSVIEKVDYDSKGGINVVLRTTAIDEYQIYYLHLSRIFVKEGEKVSAGWPIGTTGATGLSTAEHLHLGVKVNGVFVDPIDFLDRFRQSIREGR